MDRTYSVYILASRSRNLYIGITNDLRRRIIEHREGLVLGFTTQYKIFRLVYFEQFADVRDTIAREKELEGWRREKKIWLIERKNPLWQDFAENLSPSNRRPKTRSLTAVPQNGPDSG
jgi:putative endonuclease